MKTDQDLMRDVINIGNSQDLLIDYYMEIWSVIEDVRIGKYTCQEYVMLDDAKTI